MPRDNLLNSACLELFEFIKRENIKAIIVHLVETYREKLQAITYVDTFQNLILRYDQMHEPPTTQELDNSLTSQESDTQARNTSIVNGGRWQGLKDTDAEEEAYFNGSDNDDDDEALPNAVKPPAHLQCHPYSHQQPQPPLRHKTKNHPRQAPYLGIRHHSLQRQPPRHRKGYRKSAAVKTTKRMSSQRLPHKVRSGGAHRSAATLVRQAHTATCFGEAKETSIRAKMAGGPPRKWRFP